MRRLLTALFAIAVTLPLWATEPNPSARQRELIDKIFVAMKMDDTLRATLDAMYNQLEKQMVDAALADGTDEDSIAEAKELFKSFREHAAKLDLGREMHDSYVQIFAKYFSEQELADLLAFHQSPTGRKSIEVMPHLLQESMQAGAQHITPLLERAIQEAKDEHEKKRPWRRTMSDIRSVATAVEAYSVDHDEYPTGEYASLKALLVPTYMKTFPETDMWDHAYAYAVSDDHQHYRIVSAGSDTIFEWDSRRIGTEKDGRQPGLIYKDRLEDDLIYADGAFVQLPAVARPRQKPQ